MPYRLQQRLSRQNLLLKLHSMFSHLDYQMSLIDSAINNFLFQNSSSNKAERNNDDSSTVGISLPLKIKWPLMRFGSSHAILAKRLVLLYSQFSWARSWGKILGSKKSSRQLWISSVLFTINFFTWSVRCRLCWVQSPKPSSRHCWAQKFSNW